MRVGNTGRRVWWTNSMKCYVSASSHSSVSLRATSLTSTWQCLQSRQRASTTASWSSCARRTGQSSSKVGRRISGTPWVGGEENLQSQPLLFQTVCRLCLLLTWNTVAAATAIAVHVLWMPQIPFAFLRSSSHIWKCLVTHKYVWYSGILYCLLTSSDRVQHKPQMWATRHFKFLVAILKRVKRKKWN